MAVLAALEDLLERLGLVLGRLEGILDRLGGLGGLLETSWEPPWRLWQPSWQCLERLGPEKTYEKGKQSMSRGLPILISILE